ncbi:hypothetical protein EJB05_50364, partial [Eragrostis curvula]
LSRLPSPAAKSGGCPAVRQTASAASPAPVPLGVSTRARSSPCLHQRRATSLQRRAASARARLARLHVRAPRPPQRRVRARPPRPPSAAPRHRIRAPPPPPSSSCPRPRLLRQKTALMPEPVSLGLISKIGSQRQNRFESYRHGAWHEKIPRRMEQDPATAPGESLVTIKLEI